jgi:GNAT superfamily N-acetyltransferase
MDDQERIRPDAHALGRAQALLERVLGSHRPMGSDGGSDGGIDASVSLASRYPLVFEERFPGRLVAFEEEGDVRSACAYLVRELVVPGARVRVGLVGSVATDPDWRGRGLASLVLQEAERCLAREGCLLALASAGEPQFFREKGWSPIGARAEFRIDAAIAARLPTVAGVRAAGPDDFAAIQRLYARHPERVDRSTEEASALLAGPELETLVLCRTRDVAAYTCLTLESGGAAVREWGGSPSDVLALVREQAERLRGRSHTGELTVVAPPTARELIERLGACGARRLTQPLALGRLLDVEHAMELFDRFGRSGGTHFRIELEAQGSPAPRILVRGPQGRRRLGAAELLDVLCEPCGSRRAVEALERELACALPGLPLSPFLWGLDAI